jgi:hypothetical protein
LGASDIRFGVGQFRRRNRRHAKTPVSAALVIWIFSAAQRAPKPDSHGYKHTDRNGEEGAEMMPMRQMSKMIENLHCGLHAA